ncbi:unnamed protein product [Didymodactylos carnosus]|uniref:Uncharacterized protein n=1 Tax=Didymodactylos carnosus TaxID=1234261 RepID=A0A813SB80_9BILA|nr:unnamed protein product [Didymodactylos carnosus]CAF0822669.1 unnamed protein product [Didymodactylos carnosus]CAF3581541.1 unnamed protein product [Didymodactylos carnosus]CAF3606989.1 unnamed protein product [Didymodactylos carnosus]
MLSKKKVNKENHQEQQVPIKKSKKHFESITIQPTFEQTKINLNELFNDEIKQREKEVLEKLNYVQSDTIKLQTSREKLQKLSSFVEKRFSELRTDKSNPGVDKLQILIDKNDRLSRINPDRTYVIEHLQNASSILN